ncbi:alkaline-phosphatase-like protein [Choanephora cucurbitarum]|nr:alkaline-phosphatase-like protein [Choanephora cucurbitarum]
MSNNRNYSTIAVEPEDDSSPRTSSPSSRKKLHMFLGGAIIGIAGAIIITSTVLLGKTIEPVPKRNVIMMISDGFGPASETYARQYNTWINQLDVKAMLPLDEIHVGHSRTQSSSSFVTDSAAGATAFACAQKSYNGAIGVDPNRGACGTVLESAKIHHDMLTGLVVTSRVTHATPASFSAHVVHRDMENLIAEQQVGYSPLGRVVDLMFGGGRCEFTANSQPGSCRSDDRDLLAEAKEKFDWEVILSKKDYDSLQPKDAKLPLMALFSPSHMSFEIDRKPNEQPALHQMVTKALDILKTKSKEQDKGFFLMIEGSRIDMAAHNNDPAAHLYDILEYHKAAEIVKQFVDENPDTVVISTSDHETGGFSAGRQIGEDYPEYKWNPEVIHRVQNSSEALAYAWNTTLHASDPLNQQDYLNKELIQAGLGIHDCTPEEVEKIKAWQSSNKTIFDLAYIFSDMVSRRALIGWATHGHSAVDVNLYAKGPSTDRLRGSHENTEIGDFIVDYLGLNLDDITKKIADINVGEDLLQSMSKPSVYHG